MRLPYCSCDVDVLNGVTSEPLSIISWVIAFGTGNDRLGLLKQVSF